MQLSPLFHGTSQLCYLYAKGSNSLKILIQELSKENEKNCEILVFLKLGLHITYFGVYVYDAYLPNVFELVQWDASAGTHDMAVIAAM